MYGNTFLPVYLNKIYLYLLKEMGLKVNIFIIKSIIIIVGIISFILYFVELYKYVFIINVFIYEKSPK